ncbi:hypothetical protein ACG873_05980 [Mesorhizobium sp. AaZ16]
MFKLGMVGVISIAARLTCTAPLSISISATTTVLFLGFTDRWQASGLRRLRRERGDDGHDLKGSTYCVT